MQRSENIVDLAVALAKAKSVLQDVEKNAKNAKFANKAYMTLDDILRTVNLTLAENGLVIMQEPVYDGQSVNVTTHLFHSSGQWLQTEPLSMPVLGGIMQGGARAPVDAQSITGTTTYIRKLAITSLMGIAGEVDDDGNTAAEVSKHAARPQQARPAPVTQQEDVTYSDFSRVARGDGLLLLGHGCPASLKEQCEAGLRAQMAVLVAQVGVKGKPTSADWANAISSIDKLKENRMKWDEHFSAQQGLFDGYLSEVRDWKSRIAPYIVPALSKEELDGLGMHNLTKEMCLAIMRGIQSETAEDEPESTLDVDVPKTGSNMGAFQ